MHNTLVKELSCNYKIDKISNPENVVKLLNDLFNLNIMAEEYVYMLSFSGKGRVLGVFEVSHGSVCMSVLSPREVMIRALLSGAVGIMLIHNHPSGSTEPSMQDFNTFTRMKEACNLMDISLFDFIIIGEDEYFSFKEHNTDTKTEKM